MGLKPTRVINSFGLWGEPPPVVHPTCFHSSFLPDTRPGGISQTDQNTVTCLWEVIGRSEIQGRQDERGQLIGTERGESSELARTGRGQWLQGPDVGGSRGR